ncbi:MAG: GTPase Era [Clostridiales bacterium]|nr:GTPase Era [Clostridiales bacterium]
MFKSGFITIIGKANVGKSTLLNSLVNQKVSITSPKPQTTRNKINGIVTTNNYQLIFTDTPGMHKVKNKLDSYMDESIKLSLEGIDCLIYMLDGLKPFEEDDLKLIEKYAEKIPVIVTISKTDKTSFEKLYPKLTKLNNLKKVKDIIPISSFRKKNLDVLIESILKYIPEGQKFYGDDEVTDVSLKFLSSEIIREKALLYLQDEVPHGLAVVIDTFTEGENLLKISATIFCEKPAHKVIIIGKNGEMLKKIGQSSRIEIERLTSSKVFLELWVKVKENWRSNDVLINNMGYNKKNI